VIAVPVTVKLRGTCVLLVAEPLTEYTPAIGDELLISARSCPVGPFIAQRHEPAVVGVTGCNFGEPLLSFCSIKRRCPTLSTFDLNV
jgi:hypothetical protein